MTAPVIIGQAFAPSTSGFASSVDISVTLGANVGRWIRVMAVVFDAFNTGLAAGYITGAVLDPGGANVALTLEADHDLNGSSPSYAIGTNGRICWYRLDSLGTPGMPTGTVTLRVTLADANNKPLVHAQWGDGLGVAGSAGAHFSGTGTAWSSGAATATANDLVAGFGFFDCGSTPSGPATVTGSGGTTVAGVGGQFNFRESFIASKSAANPALTATIGNNSFTPAWFGRMWALQGTVAPDTTPPTLTGVISLTGITTTGFTATCPVATDDTAVTGYQYNLDSAGWVDIAAGGRSITFTGKTPGATYSVQMRAKDAVPNYSSPLTASQTLPTGGDTTVPTLTGAVVATAVTQTGYTLTWPAGADNVAVTSYERSLDGGATWTDVGNVLTGAVTGRTPGATDQVRIRAKDAAGNVSTPALSLAVPLDVYKCSILDWVLPTNSQHAIGEQWNISFHNVSTRALVAYAPAAALVAGVNGAGQASRNLVVGNAAFAQGTTYAWFATHPTNATWFAVGLATAA